jgi:hypothetical protein
MTTRARIALADCELALIDYEAGPNTRFLATRWVALITLLRTVGLVLNTIDQPLADLATRGRIKAAWEVLKKTKPEPRIFHDFIDAERYDVVHEYDPSARVNITIRLGGVSTGGVSEQAGPPEYQFVMRKGPFKGRDQRGTISTRSKNRAHDRHRPGERDARYTGTSQAASPGA